MLGSRSKSRARSADSPGNVESAIEDIQLFGSAAQVAAAQDLARNVAQHGHGLADDLLGLLRDDLRKELQLESVKSRRIFLRFTERGPNRISSLPER
jgi:hypothetical protein